MAGTTWEMFPWCIEEGLHALRVRLQNELGIRFHQDASPVPTFA
jgi:hypothetical protein